jgi:rSAM/selenodomain-associated transferase 1
MSGGLNRDPRKRRALVVVAKAPAVGKVKTRLCPPLSPVEAATLYECFLKDILTKMGKYPSVELWVAYAPEGEEYFKRTFQKGDRLLAQRGRDLGERLHRIFVDLFNMGYGEVAVADSDSPTVPLSSIVQAFSFLNEGDWDVTLGPSRDGGYYLVGLKSPREGLFRDIPWSSSAVMEKTLERAAKLGLKVGMLPLAYDIDVGADLQTIWEDLNGSAELQERAPRTHAFLKRLFRDQVLKDKHKAFGPQKRAKEVH